VISTPEEEKRLVAGALGEHMERFPLRFCKPLYFGVPPSREHPAQVNNGTATLLNLRGDFLDGLPARDSSPFGWVADREIPPIHSLFSRPLGSLP
jgi:hypothetical protein